MQEAPCWQPLERTNAFGISVATEEFQRMIDENLGGLESVKAIVDDILIWGEDDSCEEEISCLVKAIPAEKYQT